MAVKERRRLYRRDPHIRGEDWLCVEKKVGGKLPSPVSTAVYTVQVCTPSYVVYTHNIRKNPEIKSKPEGRWKVHYDPFGANQSNRHWRIDGGRSTLAGFATELSHVQYWIRQHCANDNLRPPIYRLDTHRYAEDAAWCEGEKKNPALSSILKEGNCQMHELKKSCQRLDGPSVS